MEPATATAAVADVPTPVPVHAHVPLESPTTAHSSTSPSSEGDTHNERQASLASTSTRADQSKERITVPSACVQCRSKHLKCDGLNPCTRCSSNSFECIYVRSRRGFKGPRRNGANGAPTKVTAVSGPVDRSCPMINPGAARGASNVPSGLATPPDHRLQTLPRGVDLPLFDIGQELVSFEPKPLPSGLDLRERCIEAFFYHFYPAHPFILPRDAFLKLRKEKPLDALEAAMRYVGSFYVPQAPTVALGLEAERTVYNADCPRDGFRVQAMLILTIGLDGYTYQEKALQILIDAQDLALEFGMNKREYAFINGNGSDFLEESWRRTWWEMYIVDGMIAGVHQKSTFRMMEIPADVGLPCEERDYASGVSREARIPKPEC
jgi:Fungal Zn(2)-Cys(6) binuclear cluster domain